VRNISEDPKPIVAAEITMIQPLDKYKSNELNRGRLRLGATQPHQYADIALSSIYTHQSSNDTAKSKLNIAKLQDTKIKSDTYEFVTMNKETVVSSIYTDQISINEEAKIPIKDLTDIATQAFNDDSRSVNNQPSSIPIKNHMGNVQMKDLSKSYSFSTITPPGSR
jgi:hypothetical protein